MKPDSVLSELEREPIVFFGCTWTEIVGAMRSAAFIGLIAAACAAAIFIYVGVPGAIVLALSVFVFVGVSFLFARMRLYGIAALRTGKPLYYENHARNYKSGSYIQPQQVYGRERLK